MTVMKPSLIKWIKNLFGSNSKPVEPVTMSIDFQTLPWDLAPEQNVAPTKAKKTANKSSLTSKKSKKTA